MSNSAEGAESRAAGRARSVLFKLDLWKFAELPVEVQAQVYGRILEALYARKQMAKADLRSADEERKRA